MFDEDAWIPEDDEFLFVGFFRREGIPYSEEFMPVGLVLFVVGKRDGPEDYRSHSAALTLARFASRLVGR